MKPKAGKMPGSRPVVGRAPFAGKHKNAAAFGGAAAGGESLISARIIPYYVYKYNRD